MSSSGKNSHPEAHSASLPLFRPEALAAQEKSHGEILLIRPFSFSFLTWLLLGIAAAGFVFLITGHYQETAFVDASLSTGARSGTPAQAVFLVPASWTREMYHGRSLLMRWESCAGGVQQTTGTIIQMVPAQGGKANTGMVDDGDTLVRVTVSLPPGSSAAASPSGNLRAVLPGRQRSLIHWIFACVSS